MPCKCAAAGCSCTTESCACTSELDVLYSGGAPPGGNRQPIQLTLIKQTFRLVDLTRCDCHWRLPTSPPRSHAHQTPSPKASAPARAAPAAQRRGRRPQAAPTAPPPSAPAAPGASAAATRPHANATSARSTSSADAGAVSGRWPLEGVPRWSMLCSHGSLRAV